MPDQGLPDQGTAGSGTESSTHFPARRCQRVAFSIFLCFFLRMRLRRFLISDPMTCGRLAGWLVGMPGRAGRRRDGWGLGIGVGDRKAWV